MAKTTSESKFVKAMQRRVGKKWSKFQEAEELYKPLDLPNGTYACELTDTRVDVDKNGDPYMSLNFEVLEEEHKGQTPSKFHGIKEQGKRTLDMAIEMLSVDLGRLGMDVTKLEITALPALAAKLNKEKPCVKIRFSNPPEDHPNWSPDVTILSLIDREELQDILPEEDDDIPFDDSEEAEDESEAEAEDDNDESDDVEEEDEPAGEEEDEEDSEEDDPDEILEPEKGDIVKYRKTVCTVVTLNKSKETVTLRSIKDKSKKFANVPWSEIVEANI